jgi:hypothetical protein
MKAMFSKLLLAVLVGFLLVATPANAGTKHVDCDAGDSLAKAIEAAKGSAGILEISVSGFCDETFAIRRDWVWITGDPHATINGTVRVFSSSGVRFFNMNITGPGDGLVLGGSEVFAIGLNLVFNDGNGLSMRRGSHAVLRDGVIVGTCQGPDDESCGNGVSLQSATLDLVDVSIFGARYGVDADVQSRLIIDTRGPGGLSEIAHNLAPGIQVALHSVVDLRGNTHIHDNQWHGVFAVQDSAIRILDDSVEVDGNIGCADEESSFDNWGGGSITGTDCSGF